MFLLILPLKSRELPLKQSRSDVIASDQNSDNMDSLPVTNNAVGEHEGAKEKALETGASMVQNFDPPKRLCAHL